MAILPMSEDSAPPRAGRPGHSRTVPQATDDREKPLDWSAAAYALPNRPAPT